MVSLFVLWVFFLSVWGGVDTLCRCLALIGIYYLIVFSEIFHRDLFASNVVSKPLWFLLSTAKIELLSLRTPDVRLVSRPLWE